MALSYWNRIHYQIGKLNQMVSNSSRFGYVKEVKGDKIRCVIGIKHDGSELLSPWLHTTDHRGGSRERNTYEKGQNIRISCIGGTFRNATVTPWSESESHPAPDHADDEKQEDTYQHGKVRETRNKGTNESWIAKKEGQQKQHQDQTGQTREVGGGGGGQQQQASQQKKEPGEPKMKSRMDDEGGITHRHGDKIRVAVHEKSVKMKFDKDFAEIDDEGHWINKPWKIRDKDKSPDDNK